MLGVRGDGRRARRAFLWLSSLGDLELNSCRVAFGNFNGRGKSLRGERVVGGFLEEFGIDTSHRARHAQGAWHLPCSTPRVPYCSTGGSGVSVFNSTLNQSLDTLREPWMNVLLCPAVLSWPEEPTGVARR